MNLQFYLEKLSHSEEFKKFMKKNPSAYLCSGFFVFDKKGSDNKQHFDYCIPNSKEMFSFQLETINLSEKNLEQKGTEVVSLEIMEDKIPKEILKYDFDFDDIEKMIQEEMKKQGIKNNIQKILYSLQNYEGKDQLICTIFISMLGIIKIRIDLSNKKVIEFEKKSLFDIIKVTKKKS
mgnify:CR=1 FL=1|jgi:hypothetical protein|tara:strand:+ start:1671 stop:2204 length:534 start_codon:yes stop_codon:yes gene_type:complete